MRGDKNYWNDLFADPEIPNWYVKKLKKWRESAKDSYEFQKTWGFVNGFGENNLVKISLDVFEYETSYLLRYKNRKEYRDIYGHREY